MSNIKEVTVALTPADEEALSRPTTRRRRGTRKQAGGQTSTGEVLAPSGAIPVVQKEVLAAPQLPQMGSTATPQERVPVLTVAPQPIAVAIAAAAAPTTTATLQQQPQTGGVGNTRVPVKIQTRKRTHGLPTSSSGPSITRRTMLGARILPVKRHAAPAAKPKLIVPVSKKSEEKTQEAVGARTVAATTPVGSAATKAVTRHVKKRRFAERRLTLSVKNEAKTRKHQRSVKRQVAAMTVEDIRRVLKEKGILKPKSNPPESMLRSMMQDYLALKSS